MHLFSLLRRYFFIDTMKTTRFLYASSQTKECTVVKKFIIVKVCECWIFDCLNIIIHGYTIFCKSNFHKNRQANGRFIRIYFVMLDNIFCYNFCIMRCITVTLICTKVCECNMTLSRSCNKIVEKHKFHIALPLLG